MGGEACRGRCSASKSRLAVLPPTSLSPERSPRPAARWQARQVAPPSRLTDLYAAAPFGQNTPALDSTEATFPAIKGGSAPAASRQVRTTNPSKECYA
jgi:hypothetical protein